MLSPENTFGDDPSEPWTFNTACLLSGSCLLVFSLNTLLLLNFSALPNLTPLALASLATDLHVSPKLTLLWKPWESSTVSCMCKKHLIKLLKAAFLQTQKPSRRHSHRAANAHSARWVIRRIFLAANVGSKTPIVWPYMPWHRGFEKLVDGSRRTSAFRDCSKGNLTILKVDIKGTWMPQTLSHLSLKCSTNFSHIDVPLLPNCPDWPEGPKATSWNNLIKRRVHVILAFRKLLKLL